MWSRRAEEVEGEPGGLAAGDGAVEVMGLAFVGDEAGVRVLEMRLFGGVTRIN